MSAPALAADAAALRAAVARELPDAVGLRHRLHADPRLSGDEAHTAAVVADAIGWGAGEDVAGTGRVLSRVRPGTAGSSVALRAELDALAVVERTGAPWSSASEAMHACGHDVHLAALTAVCRALSAVDVPSPVTALLQPREETAPSGARDVVRSGLLEQHRVGAVIGAHVQPRLRSGVVNATSGVTNAATDEFDVIVTGRGGHAGYPHTVRDPVLALCACVLALQQLPSRRADPTVGVVCSVNQLVGGAAPNVVPGRASARGSVRTMSSADRERTLADMRLVVEHTAAAYGCAAEFVVTPNEPVLSNDVALAEAAGPWIDRFGYALDRGFRSFGGDDFAHYCEHGRGLMLFVGVGPDQSGPRDPDGEPPGLHSERFLPADALVATVADALVAGYLAAVQVLAVDPSSS